MQKLQPLLNITPVAMGKLTEVLAQENAADSYLRIEVYQGGGCACSGGYRYGLSLEKEPRVSDVVEKIGELKVVAERADADVIRGSTLDYFDSLQRSGFKIENPNIRSDSCGCGGH
jgi:iron-sulfur cluster assembly protein